MSTLTVKQQAERQSIWLVAGVIVIALILGAFIKQGAAGQTRPFSASGIRASIPEGWLVQEGMGDLIIVARNTQSLDQVYRVNLLNGSDPVSTAAAQNSIRTGLDDTFRVLEETPIIVRGRDGYKVSYAFVEDEGNALPTVIEGVDYYFIEGDDILVISYESDSNQFAEGLPLFQEFRASVQQGGS